VKKDQGPGLEKAGRFWREPKEYDAIKKRKRVAQDIKRRNYQTKRRKKKKRESVPTTKKEIKSCKKKPSYR